MISVQTALKNKRQLSSLPVVIYKQWHADAECRSEWIQDRENHEQRQKDSSRAAHTLNLWPVLIC